ncbi:AAEL017480-PA [Gryllus bimaculatus]|nr:AAEL017480-PA [Gryllus bimaculatus]
MQEPCGRMEQKMQGTEDTARPSPPPQGEGQIVQKLEERMRLTPESDFQRSPQSHVLAFLAKSYQLWDLSMLERGWTRARSEKRRRTAPRPRRPARGGAAAARRVAALRARVRLQRHLLLVVVLRRERARSPSPTHALRCPAPAAAAAPTAPAQRPRHANAPARAPPCPRDPSPPTVRTTACSATLSHWVDWRILRFEPLLLQINAGSAAGKKLLKAAQKGRAQAAQRLLDAGADPNFADGSAWTPLHRAARKGHAPVVELLLRRGARADAEAPHGFTALHMAAFNDPSGRCTALLVAAGAHLDRANAFGRTALHYAAEFGNMAAVRVLVEAGASKAAKTNDGKTPYDMAKADYIRRYIRP